MATEFNAHANLVGSSNPFNGLRPLKAGDAIFERDTDVSLMMSRFNSGRLTLLFAGTGVGKSSFLDASLVPHLIETFSEVSVKVPYKWARTQPDIELAKIRREITDIEKTQGEDQRSTFVVILDQFEELFQHFPDEALLRTVGAHLAALIRGIPLDEEGKETADSAQNTVLDIRVLISIREDFLGELSILDDFLAGLFSNYYRLTQISSEQARTIITSTAMLRDVPTGPKIENLLADLLKIKSRYDRLNDEIKNALAKGNLESPLVRTLPVELPYLQIVCAQIWNREYPFQGNKFLNSYSEGEAEELLDAYCRGVLNKLKLFDKFRLARALAHLTGPREAKKAVRLSDLAREMTVRNPDKLYNVLNQLCAPDIRILEKWEEQERKEPKVTPPKESQESPAAQPKDSQEAIAVSQKKTTEKHVFQLYHDMYSPLLWKWRGRQLGWMLLLGSCFVLILAALTLHFVVDPLIQYYYFARPKLGSTYATESEMAELSKFRNSLFASRTFHSLANRVWREYHERFATEMAMEGDTDAALLHRFAAVGAAIPDLEEEKTAGLLGSLKFLEGTYFSSDAEPTLNDVASRPSSSQKGMVTVVGGTNDGRLVKWTTRGRSATSSQADGILPDETGSVLCFSPDGADALIAKIPNTDPFKLVLMVVDTDSNKLKSLTEPFAISSKSAPPQPGSMPALPANLVNLPHQPSPIGTSKFTGIKTPAGTTFGITEQLGHPLGSPLSNILKGMKGALSSDGLIAVLIDDNPYVSWVEDRGITKPKPIPPILPPGNKNATAYAVSIGNAPGGKHVVAVKFQSLQDLQRTPYKAYKLSTDLWLLNADKVDEMTNNVRPVLLDEKQFTAPLLGRLIFDDSGSLLVRVGDSTQGIPDPRPERQWGWLSVQKNLRGELASNLHGLFSLRADLFPQIFVGDKGLLVSQDQYGRLSVSKLEQQSGPSLTSRTIDFPNLGRLRSSQPAKAPRVITASSSAELQKGQEFLEIDSDRSTIRHWHIPPIDSPVSVDKAIPDSNTTFQECAPPSQVEQKAGIEFFYSESRKVKLVVGGGEPSYAAGCARDAGEPASSSTLGKWPHLSPSPVLGGVVFDETNFRLLAFYPDEVCLVVPNEKNGHENCRDRKDIKDVVFGPGINRVTFISTSDELSLLEPDNLATGFANWNIKWHHKCENCKLLHSEDENAVVAYSDLWLHHLAVSGTGNGSHVPHITSVLSPIRIPDFKGVSAAEPNAKECSRDSHSDGGSSAKHISNSCVQVSGGTIIDFDSASKALEGFESPGWRSALRPKDFNFCGAASPAEPKASESNPGPLNPLCEWEARSGRQLVKPGQVAAP